MLLYPEQAQMALLLAGGQTLLLLSVKQIQPILPSVGNTARVAATLSYVEGKNINNTSSGTSFISLSIQI